MELDELIAVWQANDTQISKTVKLNLRTLNLILSQKVASALSAILWQRITELSFHLVTLILLGAFLINNINQLPYALSAVALIAFYSFIFFNCLRQIQIITGIQNNKNIVSMQASLMKIQTHLLTFIRLSVICIPVFLSYPVVVSKAFADLNITGFGDFNIIAQINGTWWYVEMLAYTVLVPLGIWFYKQVNIKNMHKLWVARIIRKSSSARVTKAIAYLNELDELKTVER